MRALGFGILLFLLCTRYILPVARAQGTHSLCS